MPGDHREQRQLQMQYPGQEDEQADPDQDAGKHDRHSEQHAGGVRPADAGADEREGRHRANERADAGHDRCDEHGREDRAYELVVAGNALIPLRGQ